MFFHHGEWYEKHKNKDILLFLTLGEGAKLKGSYLPVLKMPH